MLLCVSPWGTCTHFRAYKHHDGMPNDFPKESIFDLRQSFFNVCLTFLYKYPPFLTFNPKTMNLYILNYTIAMDFSRSWALKSLKKIKKSLHVNRKFCTFVTINFKISCERCKFLKNLERMADGAFSLLLFDLLSFFFLIFAQCKLIIENNHLFNVIILWARKPF